MHTQTHMLMGACLFGKQQSRLMLAGALGGTSPDLPTFTIVGALTLRGEPAAQIFGKDYFSPWWQITDAIAHSFLLWSFLCLIFWHLRRRHAPPLFAGASFAFSAAALTHALVDFLCHREDAHMHLWPVTNWKFISPVSYYDPRHHGQLSMTIEALAGLLMVIYLFRGIRQPVVRMVLAVLGLLYLATPLALFALGNRVA